MELHHKWWGGSARSVLKSASIDKQKKLRDFAVSASNRADLAQDVLVVAEADGGSDKHAVSPHSLFHLNVVMPGYSSCTVVFASDYCRDLVLSALEKKGVAQVATFLSSAESSPSMGSLRGHLFERLALTTLFSSERSLPMICLDGVGTEVTEASTQRNLFVFGTVDDLLNEWRSNPSAVGRPQT